MTPIDVRRTKLRPHSSLLAALLALLLAAAMTVSMAQPAAAADVTITGQGSGQAGSWQVFDFQVDQDHVDVTAAWAGSADVNIFLKRADGTTIAFANGDARPKRIEYRGNQRPARIAVKVVNGSATFTITIQPADVSGDDPQDDDPQDDGPQPDGPATDYPGRPADGAVLWGSSIQGNGDPVARHEQHTENPMGVRRTFWAWRQRATGLERTARQDVAAGRLPWVSVKTPSWTSMANGSHDDDIDGLLRDLDAIDGPVWLTLHHEPEQEGNPANHLAMNRRVRQRMDALGTDNIALAPILMAWTFNPNSGRNPNAFWDDAVYDFLGVDVYRGAPGSLLIPRWYLVRDWAQDQDVDVAVGEWALRGTNAQMAAWMVDWHLDAAGSHADGRGARVIASAYFDSHKDDRRMTGALLQTFHTLIDHPNSASAAS